MSTTPQTLDVTGLPPAAVAAVAAVVEQLRAAHTPLPGNPAHRPEQSAAEWAADFRAWCDSHVSRNPNMDDSRESMYD